MLGEVYRAIYDFELLPYALGDVLTWNVQTARRAEELGRDRVDIYICLQPDRPSSIYQRDLVFTENASLYFNELFGAFGTHPKLGNLHFFSAREELIAHLQYLSRADEETAAVVADYEAVLEQHDNATALNDYFIKYIYSHERLNEFAAERGHIPMLIGSQGCEPDVQGLLRIAFAGKRIVVIHPRLRRLDAGLGGEHTHKRDSDFLEWFEFVKRCEVEYPDVQFVVLGRMQEKPLELLRCPNVSTLRAFGLGLGHELTLMLHADLFIGTSSGFAAMANFCSVPYFITHMNKESCKAYAIKRGADRLPFAQPYQHLVYEKETTEMLLGLLKRGLAAVSRNRPDSGFKRPSHVDVRDFERMRAGWLAPHASTYRYFLDNAYTDQETSFLVWNQVKEGIKLLERGSTEKAQAVGLRVAQNFPRLAEAFPEARDLIDGRARPVRQKLSDGVQDALKLVNGTIIPPGLRGTIVHRVARRLKDSFLGYRRR